MLAHEPGIENQAEDAASAGGSCAAGPSGAVVIAGGTPSDVLAQVVQALAEQRRSGIPAPKNWLLVPLGEADGEQLTPREAQVLQMVGEGLTNKEIARGLGFTVHTANRHVSNILRKLRARNRAEAVHLSDLHDPYGAPSREGRGAERPRPRGSGPGAAVRSGAPAAS